MGALQIKMKMFGKNGKNFQWLIKMKKTLLNIPDNFKKIIIVKDNKKAWYTEEGILVIGIVEFLLNKNSLEI